MGTSSECLPVEKAYVVMGLISDFCAPQYAGYSSL
jgi:hypothetical protein